MPKPDEVVIYGIHQLADEIGSSSGAIMDEVMLLIEEADCNLSDDEAHALIEMMKELATISEQSQKCWQNLLKILENHVDFYRKP